MRLDFEPPVKFDAERWARQVQEVPDVVWEGVPAIICRAITNSIGPEVPIDPVIAFRYFQNGRLPEFVVCFFMWFQKARKKTSKATIFGRAMHYLEAFRKYMYTTAGLYDDHPEYLPSAQEPISAEATVDDGAGVDPKEGDPGDPVLAADPATSAALGLLDESEEIPSDSEPLDDAFIQEDDTVAEPSEEEAEATLSADPAVLGHGQAIADDGSVVSGDEDA